MAGRGVSRPGAWLSDERKRTHPTSDIASSMAGRTRQPVLIDHAVVEAFGADMSRWSRCTSRN